MAFLPKRHADPIDRAVHDLNHQIADLQRQMREMTNGPAPARELTPVEAFSQRIKTMLAPPKRPGTPPHGSRQDLFDVAAEPLKELEAEPIAFAQKTDPDLFAQPSLAGTGVIAGNAALETAQVVPPQQKLAAYLGAGSIKTYKPLKRAQRLARNRFFMWLGLSFVALWVIWFVIR